MQAPYIPCTKSHVPLPLLRSYQRISPGPRHMYLFRNKAGFYGEDLLAPHPTPKLENHPLLAVHDCLFSMFVATFHIGGHCSTSSLRTSHAMVTGTHLSWVIFPHSVSKHSFKWACLRHMLTYHFQVLTLDRSAHFELSCNYINTGITHICIYIYIWRVP